VGHPLGGVNRRERDRSFSVAAADLSLSLAAAPSGRCSVRFDAPGIGRTRATARATRGAAQAVDHTGHAFRSCAERAAAGRACRSLPAVGVPVTCARAVSFRGAGGFAFADAVRANLRALGRTRVGLDGRGRGRGRARPRDRVVRDQLLRPPEPPRARLHRAASRGRRRPRARVEGYPVAPDSRSYRFMGFLPLFRHAGFVKVGTVGTRRTVMQRTIGPAEG
jgi:hypothetical protein